MEPTGEKWNLSRQELREKLRTEFNHHQSIKQDINRNSLELKGFKDILSYMNLSKKRKQMELVEKQSVIRRMGVREKRKNTRAHRSLGEHEQVEQNNSIMSKFVDEDLLFEFNNLSKGNLKLSTTIRLLNEQLKLSRVNSEKQNSRFKQIENRKTLFELYNVHSRNLAQSRMQSLFKEQRVLKYQKIHTDLQSTEQEHALVVEELERKRRVRDKLSLDLMQLVQKEKWMKGKIESVGKTSEFIQNYYQIENYVDSILNKYDYPSDMRKRVSKLDAATEKIIIFYNKQEALERELMGEYQQLIMTRQQLADELQIECEEVYPEWGNTLMQSSHILMAQINSYLIKSVPRLFDYYDRIPYRPYEPQSLMNFKKLTFKNINHKQSILSNQQLSDLFIYHPSIIKLYEQMSLLRKYSNKQFIKQLIFKKCQKKHYEEKTEELLTILCQDAVSRLLHIIISLIDLIKSIAIEFHKVRSKIKFHKSNRVINENKGSQKLFPNTQTKLEKLPSKSLHGIPKLRLPTKKHTIALQLDKQKSVSLSDQYDH